MGVEFLDESDGGTWGSMCDGVVVSLGDIDAEFVEIAGEELPVVEFGSDFEYVVEGVHFNLAWEVTGEDLSDDVSIGEVSVIKGGCY